MALIEPTYSVLTFVNRSLLQQDTLLFEVKVSIGPLIQYLRWAGENRSLPSLKLTDIAHPEKKMVAIANRCLLGRLGLFSGAMFVSGRVNGVKWGPDNVG